jgi:hypothetical protein
MEIRKVLDRLFYTETGQIFVCGLFGFTIALLLKRVCKDNCTRYVAPNYNEIENKVFKIDDSCFTYKIKTVKCNDKPIEYYHGNIAPENKIEEPTFLSKVFNA